MMNISVSATRLKMFNNCPRLFQAVYLEGKKQDLDEKLLNFGTDFHERIRKHLQGELPFGELTELERNVVRNIKSLGLTGDLEFEVEFSTAKFIDGQHGIVLEGIFDILSVADGVVVEIKSHNEPTESDLLQAGFYKYVGDVYKTYVVTPKAIVEVVDTEAVERLLKQFVKDFKEGNFIERVGEHCLSCPIRFDCPEFNAVKDADIVAVEKNEIANVDKLIEYYEKAKLLMKIVDDEIKKRLKSVNEIALADGRKIMKVFTEVRRLKKDISKEELFREFGLCVFKVDTEVLKELYPEAFDSYYRTSWEVKGGE